MVSQKQNPELKEVKSPTELACEWFGHVPSTTERIESRLTGPDDRFLTYFITCECVRCGHIEESDLDEDAISVLTRPG